MVKDLVKFLDESPTAFCAVSSIKKRLEEKGYQRLGNEKIEKGKKYYLVRNDSSIIAFNVGKRLNDPSLHITASHTDSPLFKLKPQPLIKEKGSVRFNIETYGGMLLRPWFDRPLKLAGRVIINKDDKLCNVIFDSKEPLCMIPSMAPHLSRTREEGKIEVGKEMYPIITLGEDFDLNEYLSSKLHCDKDDILGFDLYVVPCEKGYVWGKDEEFFTSNHIDNLECAYTTLMGFIDNFHDDNINIYCSFDNEEVGSRTRQGADSDILQGILNRLCKDLDLDEQRLVERGMMLSCDNAHALHPNYADLYDLNNAPIMNEGVVIKYNASQSYTTDSLSGALLKTILKRNEIPWQVFANKTGTRGGGTLGNISTSHVSIMSADIGLGQWAMHSPIETAGSKDVNYMVDLIKAFYQSHIDIDEQGNYSI
ncbi:MAG: M18 family aminopeptidase [Erysipelotrichaceae bacterium]|nr:M18 family aminopeptidase [Erysipelotrichaceae bacterium]